MSNNSNKRAKSHDERDVSSKRNKVNNDMVESHQSSTSSKSQRALQAKSRDIAYAEDEFDVEDILNFGKSNVLEEVSKTFCRFRLSTARLSTKIVIFSGLI